MDEIICSIIIPTIGRVTLTRAVESILDQLPAEQQIEIIIVNDSGKPLPDGVWFHSKNVRIIDTQRRRLCVARNTGATIARGQYLHFLDDDDWLTPGALQQFSELAMKHPEAGCLHGCFELVDDAGKVIAHHHVRTAGNSAAQLVCGSWLQVAAVWIRSDVFFSMGGFLSTLRISEEIDLFNRIAIHADFFATDFVVAQVRRGKSWQTTVDYSPVYEMNRWVRDRALELPDAFDRLQASARDSYWRGRLLRVYVWSVLWNWYRKRQFFTGVSRGLLALRCILAARASFFSRQYWRAFMQHVPDA